MAAFDADHLCRQHFVASALSLDLDKVLEILDAVESRARELRPKNIDLLVAGMTIATAGLANMIEKCVANNIGKEDPVGECKALAVSMLCEALYRVNAIVRAAMKAYEKSRGDREEFTALFGEMIKIMNDMGEAFMEYLKEASESGG